MSDTQFTDVSVSRKKFNREIREFRRMSDQYLLRGWLLAHVKFPIVRVIFATSKTNPVMILCGVSFDYTNYDAVPPSVRLVHPITGIPYKSSEMPTFLPRFVQKSDANVEPIELEEQRLMQHRGGDDVPFLCLAGVREYHEHPAHSGDSWELHRPLGAGRLVRLIQIISKYGLDTVNGYTVNMIPQLQLNFVPQPE